MAIKNNRCTCGLCREPQKAVRFATSFQGKSGRVKTDALPSAVTIVFQVQMSQTTAFISELIRAANEIERLTPFEVSRLLDRSVDTIRDMRERAGLVANGGANDVVIDLGIASARVRDLSIEEIRDTLIDAADVIRALRVILAERE